VTFECSAESQIEPSLLAGAEQLRDISPYLRTWIVLNNGAKSITADILTLEWMVELRRFLEFQIFPPGEYRTSLTIGGSPFVAKVIHGGRIALDAFDIALDVESVRTLIDRVYDSAAERLVASDSLIGHLENNRSLVASALATFKARYADPSVVSDPYLL
jgi:hypothetical protein